MTNEQRRYLLGKLHEARKHTVGNNLGLKNADGTFQSVQNGPIGKTVDTAVAAEQNIGKTLFVRISSGTIQNGSTSPAVW